MNRGNRYVLKLLGCASLCLVLLAVFNAAIDPYQLLGSKKIEGLNEKKTEIFYQLNTTKSYQFYENDTANLLLGTSRPGRSLDPDHPTLKGENFYSFATPGSLPEFDYIKLKSAIERQTVKRVIYTVDFFSFNYFYDFPPDFAAEFRKRLSLKGPVWDNRAFIQQALLDYGANFWAYGSLRDSIKTIRNQQGAEDSQLSYTDLQDDGFWTLHFAENRKPLEAFISMENIYLRGTWFALDDPRFSFRESEVAANESFHNFKALLSLAQEKGIELTIVILPVHARLLENLDFAGLWPSFEYWKRKLVAINEAVARSHNHAPFPFWDFNGYYPITSGKVSNDMDASQRKWFYDSAHASRNTGDRILDIIAGDAEANFGGKIDEANIENWLKTQRASRDAYRAENAETSKMIKQRVNKMRKRKPWKISPLPQSQN